MDIGAWLRGLGLERYEQAFLDNDITPAILPELTDQDLKDLGVSLGHRRHLLKAIMLLGDSQAEPSSHTGAGPWSPAPERAPAREAERRQLTVLFCDLLGSTELSARLDPEDMGALIRGYHGCCTEAIGRWDGHVAKYMGDGVLAYFGWPQAHEDDAERAVRAALELTHRVRRLKAGQDALLDARVGIATGLVMVGELIGEGVAREQAVVGETPNLASRLQALAEPGSIVISRRTRRLLGGLFELADLGPQHLKGFAEPLWAWRVLGESRAESRFEAFHVGGLVPLVGREHELGLLLDRWERAKEGEGQVVLLSGEAGIGKSRLLRSVRERLGDRSYTPLSHFCSPYHVNTALYPVINLLERNAGITRDDPPPRQLERLEALLVPSAENLAEATSLLAGLLSIPAGERYPSLDLTSQRQKQRTLEVLLEQLEGLATRQPVLSIWEDLHWVDPSSVELLDMLVDRVQRLPVLVLMAYRPEFNPSWAGYAHVTTLTLNRLGRREGAALIERVAEGKALPFELVEQILLKTDGVPLFVEELTKTVLETGLVTDAGDHYALSGPLPALDIPATLHDSLMARLDRLAPVKEVAQIGAVIGREFSYTQLAAVADRPEDQLCAALDQLTSTELIFRRGTPPEASYSFKHALVQDAAYQSLLKSKRQHLHARIAQVLSEQEAVPEVLGHHLTEAGLIDEALLQWLAAGERALQRSAYREATGHLRRGLELVELLPRSPEKTRTEIRTHIAMGQALLPLRGPGEAEAAFERAGQLCSAAREPKEQFRAIWGRWFCNYHRMDVPRMRALTHDLLASAQDETDSELVLQAHHAAWSSSYVQGLLSEARQHAEAGLRLYAPDTHHLATSFYAGHDAGACCRYTLGLTLALAGYPDRAMAMVQEAIDLARRVRHPLTLSMALAFGSVVHYLLGNPGRTRALAQEEIALSTEQRLPVYLAAGRILDAWGLQKLDNTVDVKEEIADGIEMALEHGFQVRRPFYLGLYADVCLGSGQPASGLAAIEEAIALADTGGERWYQAELYRVKAALLLHHDRASGCLAEVSLGRALEVARQQQARWLEVRTATGLGRLWAEQGRRAEARDLLAPIYGWFTEGFDTADLKDAKALLDELR